MSLGRRDILSIAAAGAAAQAIAPSGPAQAQAAAATPKRGGILKRYLPDSPASVSVLEETTISVIAPMMPVFNNLVIYDPAIPQTSIHTVRPELATGWSWSEDGRQLTFRLREGVTWHDGKPFTSADVVHTFNLITEKATDSFRVNPRKPWFSNLESITATGPHEVVMKLERRQPALLALLASGHMPIYPAHVPTREMRQRPIGTGPFRFVEYKRGEHIRLARNPNYWKPGRPYLDGIEYPIITNRATAILAFVSGRVDMTSPGQVTIPLVRDIKAQAPEAICKVIPTGVTTNVCINHTTEPFSNPQIRRALALTLDRSEYIRVMTEGHALQGGVLLPPPDGVWGLPAETLPSIPGYGGNLDQRRGEARRIMAGLGYGPDKPLQIKVSTRNLATYRDPAVILISQIKHIFMEGTLETVETARWGYKMQRKDYTIALNQTGGPVDDPDQQFFENYGCDAIRNYTGFCDPEMEKLYEAQSQEVDQAKRLDMAREIDRRLQEAIARPILFHNKAATCWHPKVKGLMLVVNSQYNGWRMEDVWLDA